MEQLGGKERRNLHAITPPRQHITNIHNLSPVKRQGVNPLFSPRQLHCQSPMAILPQQRERIDITTSLQSIHLTAVDYGFFDRRIMSQTQVIPAFIMVLQQELLVW
jgi:hypothetical protein